MPATWHSFLNNNTTHDFAEVFCLMTRNIILRMATRKSYIIQSHHAKPAVLSTSRFLTAVAAWNIESLTSLWTWKHRMHALRMAPRHTPMPTSTQPLITRKLTSTFRIKSRKVLWLPDLDLGFGMARAAEA